MQPVSRLNTIHAHTWAAAVSGTVWRANSLKSSGLLTAKYQRGPLVSALEDWVDRLNATQGFERFRWAARGKVRPSVRWKTGRQPRRLRKLEALADLRHASLMADRQAAGKQGLPGRVAPKTAKARREARKSWEAERFEDRLRDIVPARADEDNPNGWDSERLKRIDLLTRMAYVIENVPSQDGYVPRRMFSNWFNCWSEIMVYALATHNRRAVRSLFKMHRSQRIRLSAAIKLTQAAEYRAHLTRRVKPAPRRHRIRRPLYSRPRPPSAPLAPPVI